MTRKWSIFAGLCALSLSVMCILPASGQSEVKEKPPMYGYIANWQIPRAHWAEIAKTNEETRAILDKALADGTIIGYGNDENLVHEADGWTHDEWWNATSMAGLIKVLDALASSGTNGSSTLESATKHWDEVLVSRYYNWRPGSYKNGYVQIAAYKLKAEAPMDAVDMLAKNLVAPLLEKELADGTIVEYEIDETAVHTQAPGTFSIVMICPTPESIDKVNAAIRGALKSQPLGGPAFMSMVDWSSHRDELTRGNGTFK
ncbi:MAG TPA: hypothetical protein VGF82_22265 [Terracidiphilus sp.]